MTHAPENTPIPSPEGSEVPQAVLARRRMTMLAFAFGGGAWILLFAVVAMNFLSPRPQVASDASRAAAIHAGGPPPEMDQCLRRELGPNYLAEIREGTMESERVAVAIPVCFGSPRTE